KIKAGRRLRARRRPAPEVAEVEHRLTLPVTPTNLTVILATDLAQIVACRRRSGGSRHQKIVDAGIISGFPRSCDRNASRCSHVRGIVAPPRDSVRGNDKSSMAKAAKKPAGRTGDLFDSRRRGPARKVKAPRSGPESGYTARHI